MCKIIQEELDLFRINFKLDSLQALDLVAHGLPKNFKDYVNLHFRFLGDRGRHGIIWLKPDGTYEMIIDNNLGRGIGETKLHKLNSKGLVESIEELLRR
ncbi:MAG: hypothetical protein QNK85_00010 [Crocinitomicaceae bacterium]|mgnify:FL=1|jgi:hypothetical protein|tara:strand:+ start:105 stop:401 length:297 start_codon:yes stop_codon:yes gene_type:complete